MAEPGKIDRIEKKVDGLTKAMTVLADTVGTIVETVVFIKDRMVTKEELKETLKTELDPIKDRLIAVEKKVEGLYKVNDLVVVKQRDLGGRVSKLEQKVLD